MRRLLSTLRAAISVSWSTLLLIAAALRLTAGFASFLIRHPRAIPALWRDMRGRASALRSPSPMLQSRDAGHAAHAPPP